MRLLLSVPIGVVLDTPASKVTGESDQGSFTLLPRHADGVMLLKQGLLSYLDEDGEEVFVAIDEGVLVKADRDVRVACRRAVVAGDLANAKVALTRHLDQQSDHDRRARAALLSLEAEVLRRMGDLT